MTKKKIFIIFLSLIIAVSCSDNNISNPTRKQMTELAGGGGHLKDYGNGDLIENGNSDADSISAFINKYSGVYYGDGAIEFKLKDGKLYQLPGWIYSEIDTTEGIIVEPNGVKMQISNRKNDGKIEVLNFANNGLSSYSSFVLEKDTAVDTTMQKIGQFDSLKSFKGTFKEYDGKNYSSKFLSIGEDGAVYFKEAVNGSGRVYMSNGDLIIVDNSDNKNIVKFKEGNFVYRKFTRSGNVDTTQNTYSVTKDFVESLGETKYEHESQGIKIEFTKFIPDYDNNKTDVVNAGTVKTTINNGTRDIIERPTKYCVLKGNTLYRFSGNRVDWSLTFNADRSNASYSKGGTLIKK